MNTLGDNLCPSCFINFTGSSCGTCEWKVNEDNPPPALALGQVLDGRYRIGRFLGHGGFGITYLAWDNNLHLRLAIKEFLPRDCASRAPDGLSLVVYSGQSRDQFAYGLDRFLEEARALAHFDQHPGIVTVKNFFRAHGTGYCVMDYVEGITLRQYLELQPGGRISFDAAFKLLTPVMDALRIVHKEGLIHRDISPDNIYLTQEGRVKLLDFGAARFAAGEHSKSLSIILKPGYAPEEQYRTKGKQGPWTDVYGLAATFYKAITATIPPESMDRLDADELKLPSKMGVNISSYQEVVLLKALAIKAENRYSNFNELQNAWSTAKVEEKDIQLKSNSRIDSQVQDRESVNSNKNRNFSKLFFWIAPGVTVFLIGIGTWYFLINRHQENFISPHLATSESSQPITPSLPEESPIFQNAVTGATVEEGKAAYNRGDFENALTILRPFAETNHAEAQYLLGAIYFLGRGVPVDEMAGLRWYQKSADQGLAVAQLELGLLYSSGKGVAQDHAKAKEWYLKAANQGLAAAQYVIGLQYFLGNGVSQDDAKAAAWYRKAADQGLADAQHGLGFLYANGRGVKRDDLEAVRWYRLAAEQDHAEGQHKLGLMYTLGQGVSKDNIEAARWLRKAAEQGHDNAQFLLGHLYLTGDGVPKKEDEALLWFVKSADQGNTSAQIGLGHMYFSGQGVTQSDEEALRWYQKAADKNNPDAQSMVAGFYEEGKGTSKSQKVAVNWYRKAAEQGHARSQLRLGVIYSFGLGVKTKHEEAVKWYRKAADQGLDEAEYGLAVAYLNGTGIKKNPTEALRWFRKAANQGYAPAQFNMGVSYVNGEGVAKNKSEAAKWFRKAADQGMPEARAALEQLK